MSLALFLAPVLSLGASKSGSSSRLRIRLGAAACLLVLSACSRSGPPASEGVGTLEADALHLVSEYDEAWMRKDVAGVERVVAPGYLYFSSRGGVSDLAQTRATLASPGYRIDRGRRDTLRTSRYGSTVVVSSHWTGAGVFDGAPFTDDQRCSLVVGFRDGTGRVLSEHCTNIPAP